MNNEILDDCKSFAEKHRGKNKKSGPNWSTIIIFTKLFDEAFRLDHRVDFLEEYITDFKKAEKKLRDLYPRAFKLIMKEKPFIVVAIDEPYFKKVYELIRSDEMKKGTWREEDECSFLFCVEQNQQILEGQVND
jgi:hypothetical protein